MKIQINVTKSEWQVFEHIKRVFFFVFSVEGLHAIVVTDRDGVPVVKGKRPNLLYLLFLSLHLSNHPSPFLQFVKKKNTFYIKVKSGFYL